MNKIIIKIYLCACAFIIPAANCFASSLPPNPSVGFKMNCQFIPPHFNQVEEYLQGMRNADATQGKVLWGGEIELTIMAQLCDVCIIVKENQHDTIINEGVRSGTVTLHYTGNHYMYYNNDGELVDVAGDGNCMFTAFLLALGQDGSLTSVAELRNRVVDHMSADQDIGQKILHTLAGDNRVNGDADLIDIPNPSNSNPMVSADSQTKYKRCREENKQRLQEKQNKPIKLANKECSHLHNLRHAEEIRQYNKQYRQDNAEKIRRWNKQYRQDHAEEIRQYKKQYSQDNAEKIRQQHKQYNQDNAEKIRQWNKQYYQDNAEKIRQWNKQYHQEAKQRQQYEEEQGRQQARAKYTEYLQTTSDEPKKTFKAWCEQKMKIIEGHKILQPIETETEPNKDIIADLRKLFMVL